MITVIVAVIIDDAQGGSRNRMTRTESACGSAGG
jgi:hypothetical protein